MKSVAFITLGCKLNQFESAAMAGQLEKAGFEIIDPGRPADVYVINTCTVTSKTDHRSQAAVRRAQRLNPDAAIVVAGCYGKIAPDEVRALPGVDLIIGNAEKNEIVALVRGLSGGRDSLENQLRFTTETQREGGVPPGAVGAPLSADIALRATMAKSAAAPSQSAIGHPLSPFRPFAPSPSQSATEAPMIERFFDYSRAFVKVQEGCDSECAYCIIPRARGLNSSMAPDWVVAQVRKLVDAGYQEVVLCGTHLGTYGQDLFSRRSSASCDGEVGGAAINFTGLLGRILEETAVRRVRLSSIEPMEFDAGLREAIISSERICRHLHVPLQSGCDDVLKAMNRGYSTADYTELIEWFKKRCPAMCIGADVIVGFPAESESRFCETLEFIRGIDLSYLHVFSYSVRPGTPAARDYSADEQVPPEQIKRRSSTLRAESRRKRLAFHQTLLKTTLDVLVLKRTDEATGRRLALSDNYVNVLVNADESLAGRIIQARIAAVSDGGVTGELLPE